MGIGLLVLLGWLAQIPALTTLIPGYSSMKCSSASLFILSGITLFILASSHYKIARRILAVLILILGLLFFFQVPLGYSVGIDELFKLPDHGLNGISHSMSGGSAFSFASFGLALLCIDAPSVRLRNVSQYLLHLISLISIIAILGYLLSVPAFYTLSSWGSMALHTASVFLLISVCTSFYHRDLGITGLLTGNGVGNLMAKRLVPMFAVLVTLLTIIHIVLYRNSFIDAEFGIALFSIAFLLLGLLLTYFTAKQLNRINRKKSAAEDMLVDLNRNLENKIDERTSALKASVEALETSRVELWKNEALLKAVIGNISSAIFIKDLQGRYLLVNAKFAADMHSEPYEMIGKTAFELFPEAIAQMLTENETYIINSKKSETKEFTIELDGIIRTLITNKFPLLDEQGAVFALCGVSNDYTDEKRARIEQEILSTQLQRKNQQLLNFAHITSHNLRSPVSNLNSLLWLYKESETNEERALLFEKFETVIHNLSQTLNELVDALKIQEDTGKKREQLNFEEVFKKVKDSMIGKIMETEAVVSYNFTKAPLIDYPRLYLESILQNLLSNSLKYRSPLRTPVIHAETFLDNGNIILHFKDNGLGIDMNRHSDKLFGLNKTFHKHEEAKGVGLFITKTQVEAMGGNISATSEVNKGTTIIISFHKKT
jgi:PAS domain S-box-containing protein